MLHTIRLGFCVLASVALLGCSTTTSKKSDSASSGKSKWIVLFDGSSTDAWRGYRQVGFPAQGWAIENGALKTVPNVPRVDLVSRERFKDFEWTFEWKVSPGGNSGVFYGVQETEGPTYSTGAEYQVLDDSKHRDGAVPATSAGALYALIPPNSSKRLKPVGEWNQSRIVAKKGFIEHWLNGTKVVEYKWGSQEVKDLIAASKFKTMRFFMSNLDGYVALQHHGEEAWFRNIRIRRL